MELAGIRPHNTAGRIKADASLHRYRIDGDASGTKNGWYVLHPDNPVAGAFGSWKHGVKENWRPAGPPPSAAEREAADRIIKAAQEKATKERADGQERTALNALDWWSRTMPARFDHPYLVKKQVQPHGLKQSESQLLIPLYDFAGRLWNIQRVQGDGLKLFMKGGKVSGLFSPIGSDTDKLIIAEGWATGATLYEMTGRMALCAMNAGNLLEVCQGARAKWPNADIIVAADNDRFTKLPDGRENPGLIYARKAAAAIGARLSVPQFPADSRGTDFNDLAAMQASRGPAR
jgi:putative DNA primase/helicase